MNPAIDPTAVATRSAVVENSAVSWPAIIAGGVAATALTLILFILGAGLGLSSVSPWSNAGAGAAAIGISAILWITLTQVLASGLGGFIAGRLRSRWHGVDSGEVFFRDSAHGFLAWALATLLMAGLFSSALSSAVSSTVSAGATIAGGAVATVAAGGAAAAKGAEAADNDYFGYYVDSLYRKASAQSDVNITSNKPPRPEELAEVTRIFATSLKEGALSEGDAKYLGQQIAQRTNLSTDEATQRVNDTFTQLKTKLDDLQHKAREAADQARKASAYTALWLFISLLIGAFVASLAATKAARSRDDFQHTVR
jgi:hypothetical protein